MALKRTYQVESKYTKDSKRARLMAIPVPVSKRPVTPEVKELLFTVNDNSNLLNQAILITNLTSGITQGVAGNQRIGNRIKLLSIEITGRACGNQRCDGYIVCPKNSFTAPTQANFSLSAGARYDADVGWTIMQFAPFTGNMKGNAFNDWFPPGMLHYKWTNGMEVQYDAANSTKNAVFMVIRNGTGLNLNAIDVSCTVRLRFVDA